MFRGACLAAILTLMVLCGCASKAPGQNAAQDVIALERSALDKWAQGNTHGYVEIGAEDVTWFDFNPGPQRRVEGVGALSKLLAPLDGHIPQHTYELADPKVQVYENTAILTFHWSGTTRDGQPLGRWKVTSAYHWKDGKWRMVHAHWSVVQAG